jgi:hypothetical protein
MTADTTHRVRATGKAMTLGELREFVKQCDELGAADSSRIDGRVGFGAGVQALTITVVRFGDPEPPTRLDRQRDRAHRLANP